MSNWTEVSEILPNELYLGSIYFAEDRLKLHDNKIKSILTLYDGDMRTPQGVVSKNLTVSDYYSEDLLSRFEECFEFIENCPKPVLVHCEMGVSRSSTVVIAYLIHKGKSLREAYDLVYSKRPCINPNNGFWKQLYEFSLKVGRDKNDLNNFICEHWTFGFDKEEFKPEEVEAKIQKITQDNFLKGWFCD